MTTRPTMSGEHPATGPVSGAGNDALGDTSELVPARAGAPLGSAGTAPAERTGPARPAQPRPPQTRDPRPAAAKVAAAPVVARPTPAAARAVATHPPTRPDPPGVPDRTGSGAAAARPTTVRQGPRRARLLVTRLDPWSVMKTFFMLSVAVAIVLVVAVALLWWTLDVTGVFAAINRTVDDVVGTGSTPFDFMAVAGFDRVMGATLVLAAVEIVLVSAMATLFAFLYNLTVGFTRGLEVTLTEDG